VPSHWFEPLVRACGACVAQMIKKRPNVTPSNPQTCNSRRAKPRHPPLCSNTAHSIDYVSPNSAPHVLSCSEFARNAPSCTLQSPTALHCPHLRSSSVTLNFICLPVSHVLYVYTTHVNVNHKSLPPHSGETDWRTPCHENRAHLHPPS
jgi:hypothetical protein